MIPDRPKNPRSDLVERKEMEEARDTVLLFVPLASPYHFLYSCTDTYERLFIRYTLYIL